MVDEVSSAGGRLPASAENLFSDFITRVKRGEQLKIDDLCREYPEHEEELRRRHGSWQRAGRALGRLGIEPPTSRQTPKTERPASGGIKLPAPAPELYSTRYSIGSEIGRGGMGSILSVRDEHLDRKLAMKVLRGQEPLFVGGTKASAPTHDLARFLEEARITGGLQHPNIVPVYELGADPDGKPYFTMKLVEGRTFREVLPLARSGEEGWNVERALGVLLKVCQAVGYAHDKDVIHRDLKPSNLMVGSFGEVYVMDWGLARDFSRPEILRPDDAPPEDSLDDTSSSFRTRDGEVLGTPEYMAPEQAAGNREEIGPRSDVYSVGAMLYELLTGQSPNASRGRSDAHVRIAAAIGGAPKEVRLLAPRTPAELCAICERAIARNPQDRYPRIIELADDLQAYLEGRVVKAHATGAWAEFRKWIQRNPAIASLAGTMIALVGVGFIVIAETNQDLLIKTLEATQSAAAEKKRADEVMHLSLSQDYEDLVLAVGDLWPPHPKRLADLRAWVAKAAALTEELPKLVKKRDELRATALEQTPGQRQAERESHPEFEKLTTLVASIASKRNMLAVRRGDAQLEIPEVDWSRYPSDAGELNDLAWAMVSPDRKTFGQEALGLALALRARELAPPNVNKRWISDIGIWARLAVGDGEGALDEAYSAMENAANWHSQDDRNFEKFEAAVASGPEGLTAAETEITELETTLMALEARVSERRVWAFHDEPGQENRDRWWHNQLSGLILELTSLGAVGVGLLAEEAVSDEHGWSVLRRLRSAERLQDGFAPGGEFALRWERDLPGIRAAYPDLQLTVQMGLVPIGPDPDSNLWEFWEVPSGTEPLRGVNGKLQLEQSSGLVFVLLPGGKFWMGAQSADPGGRNYDKDATIKEGPVHEVELSAFFLSKYEMTQGQWKRLTGSNPSLYGPDGTWGSNWVADGSGGDLVQPVTGVSWRDCDLVTSRCGLTLPTEAQWEYGCRAGTSSVFWSGDDKHDLQDVANLEDKYAVDHGAPTSWEVEEWLYDGYTVHAPVDHLKSNAFGIPNVHGNVWEWCLDVYEQDFYRQSDSVNPLNLIPASAARIFRGGSFGNMAHLSRAANRGSRAPSFSDIYLGLRPAARVTTE